MNLAVRASSTAGRSAYGVARTLRPCTPALYRCAVVSARGQPSPSWVVRAEPNQTPAQSPTEAADKKQALEDLPPWVRREREREMQAKEGNKDLPWGLYLLFSTFTAIAGTGSIFEFINKNPLFGVLPPDNVLWAPILLFMAVTGYPVAGFLFKKGIDGFNEAAERQDRMDGYL